MKKVYMIVVMALLAMAGYATPKTVTISMSKDIDGDAFGRLLVDNGDWGPEDLEGDGDGNVQYPGSPFIFNYYAQDGAEYDEDSNLFAMYGYMAIKCTEGNIIGLEAELSGWDDEDKPKGCIRGGLDFKWDDPGVGNFSLNKNDDGMLLWEADNDGYPVIVMDISNNAIWFNKLIITYDEAGEVTPSLPDPVVTTISMSKDIDGDAFGRLLVDNGDWGPEDLEGDGDGNVQYPGSPFIFNYYSQDGAEYDEDSNLFAMYGYMAIKCTEGNIIGLEAELSGWDDEDKPKGCIRGGLDFKWDDPGVGNFSLNKNDDEMLLWEADNDGYPVIVMDISNNAIWFNKLTITYRPFGSGGDDPVVTPPDAPEGAVENRLIQSDLTDTFNPESMEEDITIIRDRNYNVYGFDFNFSGSNSNNPTFVYKTNSDDDVVGEVSVYGGDSFSITTGKTIDKEPVTMSYATFKLTSSAKVTVDKGQVAVNGLNMTWWGDPTESVVFTVSDPEDSFLAFKEVVIYTDKDIFVGGVSSGTREYYNIKDGSVTQANVNLYAESNPDFSLTLGAIAPNLGVDIKNILIKVDGNNKMADIKKGQYSCATFEGPFSNSQSIPVEISFIYDEGMTTIPFSVTYPNTIVYTPNAPFTFKNVTASVDALASVALEMVNEKNLPLTYVVADPSIASVDEEGNVTGLKAGETTVTASFAGNSAYLAGTSTMTIVVRTIEAPLSIESAEVKVEKGKIAAINLNNPENLAVTYTSSDPEIATVDAEGVVTGVAVGSTTVSIVFDGDDVYEPMSLVATITVEIGTGIVEVSANDGNAIYFNLQGQRIYSPAQGTVVIRVEGNKAVKTIIK